jgi:hypothetical protein
VQERNLQPRDVREEDCNGKSDDGGKEDIDILRWRMLERAQSAAPSCEQITNGGVMKKLNICTNEKKKKERTPIA